MDILQQAAKIKGAQMAKEREKYETYPQCLKNSVFGGEKEETRARRLQPIVERRRLAEEIKAEGNRFFKNQQWREAIDKYEEAVGLLRYLKNRNLNWRKEGLLDKDITLVEDYGDTTEDRRLSQELVVQLYNNIASAQLRNEDWKETVMTTTMVLADLSAGNAKALYRRAQARYLPPGAGAVDLDFAIKDLTEASQASPEDPTIRDTLKRYRDERARNNVRDRATFGGMFDRGSVYNDAMPSAAPSSAAPFSRPAVVDLSDWSAEELKMRETLMPMAEMQGFDLTSRSQLKEMIDEAQTRGIDLHDPQVAAELQRLARAKKDGLDLDDLPMSEEPSLLERPVQHRLNLLPWIGMGFTVGLGLLYVHNILTDLELLPKPVDDF